MSLGVCTLGEKLLCMEGQVFILLRDVSGQGKEGDGIPPGEWRESSVGGGTVF